MKVYLQMFLWMMLFVMIVELIFPDSSYRKYLKLVLGCILVYTMLNPLIRLLPSAGESYEEYINYYKNAFSKATGTSTYDAEVALQHQQLKVYYEQSIKALIEKEFKLVEVKNVEVGYQMEEREAILSSIYVVIAPKAEKEGSFHLGSKGDTLDGDEENLKNKIKTCLENFYNANDCNIYITVQKN